MRVFIGMETSGVSRRAFEAKGHHVISCDLLPADDGATAPTSTTSGHFVGDVFECLDWLWSQGWWPDLALFHPTCTYLTISAEWAYKDPDYVRYPGVGYHQKLKPETLFGEARRNKREEELNGIRRIFALPIATKIIENPVGVIGTRIRKPSQIVQPYECGDDASKKTCFWYLDKDGASLPVVIPLNPFRRVLGRLVDGVERWANQTDKGQNRLTPGEDRWKERSATYPGIANFIVDYFG